MIALNSRKLKAAIARHVSVTFSLPLGKTSLSVGNKLCGPSVPYDKALPPVCASNNTTPEIDCELENVRHASQRVLIPTHLLDDVFIHKLRNARRRKAAEQVSDLLRRQDVGKSCGMGLI